jgi:hypothetical protein
MFGGIDDRRACVYGKLVLLSPNEKVPRRQPERAGH